MEKKTLPEFLASCLATDFEGHTPHSVYHELEPHMGKEEAFAVARDGNTLRSHVSGSRFAADVAARTPDREVARSAQERAVKLAGEAAKVRIEIRVFLRGLGYVV